MHTALSNTISRFKISQYHPTSVRIFWKSIQDVTGYTVQVVGPDSAREIPITNKFITSAEISDVLPSTQYTYEVSAMTIAPQRGETLMCTCVIIFRS
jgi:hypothetical protein